MRWHPARPRTRLWGAGLLALGMALMALPGAGSAGATVAGGTPGSTAATPGSSRCPEPSATRDPSGPGATAVVAQEAAGGRPEIEIVRYPRPKSEGAPWSQWGQGLVLEDGRFLSAIGNHLGKDGNAFLYVYDPARSELAEFADVRSAAGDALDWGYGKVHGQIVRGPCGDAYFATYWGTRTGLTYTDEYRGDLLFRVDPDALTIRSVGAPVARQGLPSLAGTADGTLIYGEGVDPAASERAGRDVGAFFAFDPMSGETVYRSDAAGHTGFRNVLVDARGDAYVAGGSGRLLRYTPGTDGLVDAGVKLPGRRVAPGQHRAGARRHRLRRDHGPRPLLRVPVRRHGRRPGPRARLHDVARARSRRLPVLPRA